MILPTQPTIPQLEWQVKHNLELAQQFARDAVEFARKAQYHYFQMYENCRALYEQGAHRLAGMDWEAYYCNLTGHKNASRYYQLKRVYEYAMLINEETGILPTEWELREFPTKAIAPTQKQAVLEVFNAAQVSAQLRKNNAPDKSDYEAAQDVVSSIASTLVTSAEDVEEKSDVDAIIETYLERYHHETEQRRKQHIAENSNWEIVSRHKAMSTGLRKRLTGVRVRSRLRVNIDNAGQISILNKQRKE